MTSNMEGEKLTNENTVTEEHVHEEVSNTSQDMKPVQSKKGLILFVLAVVLVAGTLGSILYATQRDQGSESGKSEVDPSAVRAVVNGEEITQVVLTNRLQEAAQVLSAQGVDLSNPEVRTQIESQVLDDTINYTLLKQGAKKEGTTVSTEEIDTAYETYIVQAGGEQELQTQLEQINLTAEEFKERLKEQLTLDAYIAANVSATEVSAQDIQNFYNTAVSDAPEGTEIPPLEEVKEQVSAQLATQKQQDAVQEFVALLKLNAQIEIK